MFDSDYVQTTHHPEPHVRIVEDVSAVDDTDSCVHVREGIRKTPDR